MRKPFSASSCYNKTGAPVAQWIEHWFPVPGVVGSTPAGCTIIQKFCRTTLPLSSEVLEQE